jgi:hypothetical protein
MSELLKEYITLIVEGQSDLLSNKTLGFAAEWATWEAWGGRNGLLASKKDNRIVPAWNASSLSEKKQYDSMYSKMVGVAKREVKNLGFGVSPPLRTPDAASATEKVDVPTKNADVHVKFNDASRLAGFQRSHGDVESSAATVIYDNVMKTMGSQLANAGVNFIDKSGFLRRPSGVKGKSKMTGRALKDAKALESEFQNSRNEYRDYFTKSKSSGGNREAFLKALGKPMEKAILKDIRSQLMGGSGRSTVYFKYFTKGNDVTLQTHQYDLSDLIVQPILDKETTIFYKVTDSLGEKVYFYVEFRMDGGGHPPQLKVGPDLDVE